MAWNFVRLTVIGVTICLLHGALPRLQAQGYWKRTNNVEYDNDSLPNKGTLQKKHGDWDCKFEAGDSTFTQTATFRDVTIVTSVTWGGRPLLIVPGEVIPVSGRANVLVTKGPGGPTGRADLNCVLARKKVEKGKVSYPPMKDLFAKVDVTAVGKAGETGSAENTTELFGEKGKNYPEHKHIYLYYSASTQPVSLAAYRIAYEYEWVAGPVSEELRKKMNEELEAFKKKAKDAEPGGEKKDPKLKPNAGGVSLIDATGTWTIYSLGETGTADEKKVHYKGSLVLSQNANGQYSGTVNFGSSEKLTDVTLEKGVLHFTRPLQGVTQKYTGKASGADQIEGTFTHNTKTFSWRAEKGAPKKGR